MRSSKKTALRLELEAGLFSAERAYGVDFIRQKIDEKKRERASVASVASEPCT
jgi:hypothetical protein